MSAESLVKHNKTMAATSDNNKSDALLEQENAAILCVLTEADEYYKEQQRLGKTIRKGFLDLAKARQAVGPSSSISALNVREELSAQFSVDADDAFDACAVDQLAASAAFRARKGGLDESRRVPSSESLRRRGDAAAAATADATTCEEDAPPPPRDTVLLFAGMPPPALRKAKKEFVTALQHAIKLANAGRRIRKALDAIDGANP